MLEFAKTMRAEYREMIPKAGTPDPVLEVSDLKIPASLPSRQIDVRLYRPKLAHSDVRALPVVLFVHGGGWVSGDLETHDVLARAIANRAEALVLAVDYRLAPEHKAPSASDDVYAVLQWLATNSASIGADAARIAISGDSAGGNLSAVVAMIARDTGGLSLKAQWLMYPAVSFDVDTPSYLMYGETEFPQTTVLNTVRQAYLAEGMDRKDPMGAPLYGNLNELPALLLSVGSKDPLLDGGKTYVQRIQDIGGEAEIKIYPNQSHGFIQFFKDKATHSLGEQALDDGIAFLRDKLAL